MKKTFKLIVDAIEQNMVKTVVLLLTISHLSQVVRPVLLEMLGKHPPGIVEKDAKSDKRKKDAATKLTIELLKQKSATISDIESDEHCIILCGTAGGTNFLLVGVCAEQGETVGKKRLQRAIETLSQLADVSELSELNICFATAGKWSSEARKIAAVSNFELVGDNGIELTRNGRNGRNTSVVGAPINSRNPLDGKSTNPDNTGKRL